VKGIPALEYAARYDRAVCLMNTDDSATGHADLLCLYEETYKQGVLPPVDASLRTALRGGDRSGAKVKKFVAEFAAKGLGVAVVTMARQCVLLEDPGLADQLVDALLRVRDKGVERTEWTLSLLEYRIARGQWDEAERLLVELLDDPKQARRPGLWRLGYAVSANRNKHSRAVERLERALDLEYTQVFGVLNIEEVRHDYQVVLAHFAKQAEALRVLDQKAPAGFVAKVTRTADRWRALDPAGMAAACPSIAILLRQVGEPDLAWDYQTTPLAQATTESSQWYQLAGELRNAGETEPADRAYASAFALDPTNAQILWDRAHNLTMKGGMTPKARDLYGEIVEGNWDAKYQHLKEQAKAMVER
jgi:tetratricopeptide (TPR) repeat protein